MEDERIDRVLLPLFDGSNFAAWKFRMLVLLEEHELVECVQTYVAEVEELIVQEDDTNEVKSQKAKKLERRVKKDRRCKSLLISRIHDTQLEYVRDKQFPKDIWDALHRVFERRSIASRMHLKREMLQMRFEGGNLQQHFLRFDKLVREYRSTGAVLEDLDVVCHLLLTLGPSYSGVVTALETMPEDNLSIEFVKCRLLDEETKRRGIESPPSQGAEAAFSGTKQMKKKKLICFHCKKDGHKQVDCPNRKKQAKHQRYQKSTANVAEADAEKGVCFIGVRGSMELPEGQRTRWYIDSGATDHLVRDKMLFSELHRLEKPIEIAVAKDGETIVAEHAGTVKVISVVNGKQIDCIIEDALFIPKLRCNLFSVMKVEKAGMRVVFEFGEAKVYRGSKIVASASRREKLYELDFYSTRQAVGDALLSCGRIQKTLELWHRRYGHLNENSLKQLLQYEMVSGMRMNSVDNCHDVIVCESCVVSKQTRKPFSASVDKHSSRVLELVHTDVCGPVTPVGLLGVKYFVTFTDDWSHFTAVYLMQSKDQVLDYFEEYEAWVTAKFGQKISRLRCDNGGEYKNKRFLKFCRNKGVQVEWTVPYTPQQNGLSERLNRTLVEKARAMLDDSSVDKRFWGQAVLTAAYLINRSPTNALKMKQTPFERWESRKPNVSNIRIFGCKVFVHVPDELRSKLDPKAWSGIFLGYSHNGYRVWNPVKEVIVVARDVDFVENEVSSIMKDQTIARIATVPENGEDGHDKQKFLEEDISDGEFESFLEEEGPSECSIDVEDVEDQKGGRPQRKRSAPSWHQDFEMEYASFALSAMNYVDEIPSTITELQKRDDWKEWKAAIEDELISLKRNNTWTLVKKPEGRSVVSCKWVFRMKRGEAGKPEKYKARLVARGFSQKRCFDYSETYSPVAKMDTLRTVLALANQNGMHIHQMDVKTAFLNGDLVEEIFMTQPDGFEQGKGLVCKLNRALYGLKQASRAWNDKFNRFMEKLGFVRSANDQCLYILGSREEQVILVLYVDDILISSPSLKALHEIKRRLFEQFEMTDTGEVKQFLGLRIERNFVNGIMKINQRDYLVRLLKRFGMSECKPKSTPIENRLKLGRADEKLRTDKPYRELVGCLIYASLITRPDLSATINYFSQFQACPSDEHWNYLKQTLRYVKGTLDVELVYHKQENVTLLEVFSDADWANNIVDRRSVSGYVCKVYGCAVAWMTRKQQTVALSSTEAELAALCTAVSHVVWMRRLLDDLGRSIEEATPVFEDNQSTIRIAENSKDYSRLKHVDTKFHFVRDLVQQGVIDIQFIQSSDQEADIMTKGLPVTAFRKLCSKLGLEQSANCSG